MLDALQCTDRLIAILVNDATDKQFSEYEREQTLKVLKKVCELAVELKIIGFMA